MNEEKSLHLSMPEYDPSTYSQKYHELSGYSFSSPKNLSAMETASIVDLFSEVQSKLERVHTLLMESTQMNSLAKAAAEATKFTYEEKYNLYLSSENQDEYESVKLLEAKVANLLKEEKRLMQRTKLTSGLFKAYHDMVQSTYHNLESAKEALTQQVNLLKKMMLPPTPFQNLK